MIYDSLPGLVAPVTSTRGMMTTQRTSRLEVARWFFNYMTRSNRDTRLDPYGAIATLAAEVLDHNLLERAATRDPFEIFVLRQARYSFKNVAPTCERVPELKTALIGASAAMHLLRTVLKDQAVTDLAAYIEAGRAAAQRVRDLMSRSSKLRSKTLPPPSHGPQRPYGRRAACL